MILLIIIFGAVTIGIGSLTGSVPAGMVLGVLAAGGYYVRDVKRHPRVRCRICTGSGDEYSQLGGGGWFRKPFGDCWCCGGEKAHPRLALRFIDSGKYREIKGVVERAKGKT